MAKPCKHDNYVDKCRFCWLFENDNRYRLLWEEKEVVEQKSTPTFPQREIRIRNCNCRNKSTE